MVMCYFISFLLLLSARLLPKNVCLLWILLRTPSTGDKRLLRLGNIFKGQKGELAGVNSQTTADPFILNLFILDTMHDFLCSNFDSRPFEDPALSTPWGHEFGDSVFS